MRIGMCLAAVNGGEVHRKPGALRKTTGLFPSLPTPPPPTDLLPNKPAGRKAQGGWGQACARVYVPELLPGSTGATRKTSGVSMMAEGWNILERVN